MQYIAMWGPKKFLCTPNKVIPFEGFNSTLSAKTETQERPYGKDGTFIRGLDLEKISLSTTYVRGAGVDPWGQLMEWRSLTAKRHTLFIGGKRFGPEKLMLKEVAMSDVVFNNAGIMQSVRLDLSFEEYVDEEIIEEYVEEIEYEEVIEITASTEDKAARKR